MDINHIAFHIKRIAPYMFKQHCSGKYSVRITHHVLKQIIFLARQFNDSAAALRLVPALKRLRARYVLPSHQDNFFVPLDHGFHFNALTDFRFVRRQVAKHCPDVKLILLDYFKPWTLP